MQHGIYITEFEKALFARRFVISRQSLSDLVSEVDFSKLAAFPEGQRRAFYEALADSIADQPRGVENGLQILGEDDARKIVKTMAQKAEQRTFAALGVRDIWCMIFIGGCP
jgi:hypothetical protein